MPASGSSGHGPNQPYNPGVSAATNGLPKLSIERILLASPRGYCAGVDRAVQTVELALERYGAPVYVRKEIVHNKHVVDQLRKRGAMVVVDTEGDALRQAVRAEPDLVTPNLHEAEELIGQEFADDDERAEGLREIVRLGAREALMTSPDGCWAQILVDGAPQCFRATIERREPVAKVGSGDAFLAGYLAARYNGSPAADCLRFAVACGAESTERLGAGLLDPRAAERLRPEVDLVALPLPASVG